MFGIAGTFAHETLWAYNRLANAIEEKTTPLRRRLVARFSIDRKTRKEFSQLGLNPINFYASGDGSLRDVFHPTATYSSILLLWDGDVIPYPDRVYVEGTRKESSKERPFYVNIHYEINGYASKKGLKTLEDFLHRRQEEKERDEIVPEMIGHYRSMQRKES